MKNFDDILSKIIIRNNKKLEINLSNNLFSTIDFNNLLFKNKFCYIGKSDKYFLSDENKIKNEYFDFYLNVSRTGVGSIFTGGFQLNCNKNTKKNFIQCFKNLKDEIINFTTQIHQFGTKIFYTIDSGYGRADLSNTILGLFAYSASYNRSYNNSNLLCKKINDKQCNKIIDLMALQANLALKFCFDGIMVNGDLFGLIGEFSSPETNRRKLGYYIEYEDFSKKLINKILYDNKLTKLFYKITLNSFLKEIYGDEFYKIKTVKNFKSSFNFNDIVQFLIKLVKLGIDGFIFKCGTFESAFLDVSTMFQNDNLLREIYLEIDKYFKENNIKNKFNNDVFFIYDNFLYDIPNELSEKDNYIFDFSRQILADNLILTKIKNKTIFNNCIKCGFCDGHKNNTCNVSCIFNNNLLIKNFEYIKNANIYEKILKNQENNKNNYKIAVIGAGISGIHCTIFLLQRGYFVDLYEKNEKINKSGRLREIFGYNYLLKNYNDYIEKILSEYLTNGKLKIYLETEFNKTMADINKYQKIILATGFYSKFSTIPGSVLPNVKNIFEILSNSLILNNKSKVVIEAKSELSLSLAQYLLLQGKKVTLLLTSLESLMKMENSFLTYYLFSLKQLKCNVILFPKICKIESDFVELLINFKLFGQDFRTIILNYKSKNNFKINDRAKNIDMDIFIYEPEICSNNKLYIDLVSSNYKGEVFVIGNALYPCDFDEAIKMAYYVSKNLY